eukprot:403376146
MNPTQHKNRYLKVAGFVSACALASAAAIIALSSGPQAQHAMVLADFPKNLLSERVELYQGTMFNLNMMSLEVMHYKRTINQKLPQDYDRKIQSLRVGKGARVKLCKFENCADEPSSLDKTLYDNYTANFIEIVGPYSAPFLIDGYSNWARHVEVNFVDQNPLKAIDPEMFVQAFNNQDQLIGAAGAFPDGEYSSTDILQRFNSSNTALDINYLIVQEGAVATIYSNEYLSGDGWKIYGPTKVNIQDEKRQQNFKVKSIKVEMIYATIYGKWERVTSSNTGPLITTIQRGWDQKEVNIPEDTLLNLFKTQAELGIYIFQRQFDRISSMTTYASIRIFDSTIESLKSSKISETDASCDIKSGQDYIALYQWTYKVSIVGQEDFYVYDTNQICRYGELAKNPPSCALNYCATFDCTTCLPYDERKPYISKSN